MSESIRDYCSWVLVFEHILDSSADYFTSVDEILSCSSKHKYSVLGKIESHHSFFRYRGKYEFKLEYPELNGYNQWSQTIFPTKAQPDTENGYENIDCKFVKNSWHGLSLTMNTDKAYLDGSPYHKDTWFFPIGQKGRYFEGLDCLPNPNDDLPQRSCLRITRLWIKKYKHCTLNNKHLPLNTWMNFLYITIII